MAVHLMDSAIFASGWASPELRTWFDDAGRTRGWLEVMAVLAETQADFRLIPPEAAAAIERTVAGIELSAAFFAEVAGGYRETNHSLLGLIRAVQRRCPGSAGEWLCYGATVQDVTDTHMARLLLRVRLRLLERLTSIEQALIALCRRHRATLMCGRTHGQPGLPVTFGFKAAGWLDEFQRHRQRLQEIEVRIRVGQLAGGVGSLSSFGRAALELQRSFLERLGLEAPAISWTAARDRFAEWTHLLALTAATCDRIGHEIYNLQRPEIGELREGFVPGTVGSITMPQKRNPELSEHLGTLARIVRHAAAHMNENLVHDHERDGRAWKGEWIILPEACLAAEKALALLADLLGSLEVDCARMRRNLDASRGFVFAEAVMLALAPALGKQSAHELVYALALDAKAADCAFQEAVRADDTIRKLLSREQLEAIFDLAKCSGFCGEMIDRVLARLEPAECPEPTERPWSTVQTGDSRPGSTSSQEP